MNKEHPTRPTDSTPPPDTTQLIEDLRSDAEATRLAAVQQLGQLSPVGEFVVRYLEQTAAQDSSAEVRQAALAALAQPTFRDAQRSASRLATPARQIVLTEIERWQNDGLLTPHLTNLLRQRYTFAPPQTAKPDEFKKDQPATSLSDVLLSEAAIKVALYLGAFFVLAAAAILAAVIEGLRLPILGAATLGFLAAALLLKKRLPQASFVLFVIFSFLLPIDAGVLLDLLNVGRTATQLAWIGVAALLSLIWVGGMWLYRSRFFSVLAWAAVGAAALQTGRWLDLTPHLDLFLLQLVALVGLGGVALLRLWRGRPFSLPLWWAAQIFQPLLLAASAGGVLLALVDQPLTAPGWWWVIGAAWLAAALFYAASYRLARFVLFPWLAVAALLPAPLLALQAMSPGLQTISLAALAWGIALALAGELLARRVQTFALPLSVGAPVLLTLAAILGWADRAALGLACLLVATLLYTGLSVYRPRWWAWTLALMAGAAAYFTVFFLPAVRPYHFYPGFVILWPALALTAAHLVFRRGFQAGRVWHLPPLLLGVGVGSVAVLALAITGLTDEPGRAAIGFAVIAGFAALFALADRRPLLGYGATAALAVSVGFGLLHLEQETWVTPLMGLALLYVVAGFGLARQSRRKQWAEMLRWSGLALGTLVSVSAPLQGGAAAVIGVAVAATGFAVEAWYRRNIWLGFPAALLYLGSYFILLVELNVTEPQVYSIGAALLGFIMHYLLTRTRNGVAAFFTGLTSQLILLSTTYIQMVATDRFLFFGVLFAQALVVLTYGLVVRSRSLVGAPLLFVVLGVITVVIGALSGVPALLLVGCTGFLLLLLGIAALLQRERLLALSGQLGGRLAGWQA